MTRRIRNLIHLPTSLAMSLTLGLALVAACDDSGEQRKDTAGTPGTTPQDGTVNVPGDGKIATPPALQKYRNPAEAIGAYNKCYSDCFTAQTNATNRETCKLDCDTLVETGMDSIPADADKATYKTTWTGLRTCINGCWADRKLNETNRATCLLTCSDAAEMKAIPAPVNPGPQPIPGVPPGTIGAPPTTGTLPGTATPPTAGTPPATGTTPPSTPPALPIGAAPTPKK